MKRKLLLAVAALLCTASFLSAQFIPQLSVQAVVKGVNVSISLPTENVHYPVSVTVNIVDGNQNGWGYGSTDITSGITSEIEIRGLGDQTSYFADVQVTDAIGQTYGKTLDFTTAAATGVSSVSPDLFTVQSTNGQIVVGTNLQNFKGFAMVYNYAGQAVGQSVVTSGTTEIPLSNSGTNIYLVVLFDKDNLPIKKSKVILVN
jgi:hypothetical protein